MKLSIDRILTTHTGSLPRAQDLTTTLEALDAGTLPDPAAFEARVRRAVGDIVRQQLDAGVDIVNDGEQGKVGYSTYVRHRLTGFDGQAAVPTRADWADFPAAAARSERRSTILRTSCNGPIEWKDRTAVQKDVTNFKTALSAVKPADAVMMASPPGVIAGGHRPVQEERGLPEPRRVPGAPHRRHEGGVRRDPSGRARASDRLPRPGNGAAPHVPRAEQRRVPQDRRGQHRGPESRPA